MATAAQIFANHANAAHSTGPRTVEGKARVCQNALRHGLIAAHLVVRDDERESFEQLRADLLAELAPQGAVETVTFNDLLHAAWNLERFRRLEAERTADLEDEAACSFLERLGRYQARAQRAYYRALKELRILQTNRALRALKLSEKENAQVPAIADINNLTKQTQSEVTAEALDLAVKVLDRDVKSQQLDAMNGRAAVSEPAAAPQKANPALRL